MGSAYVRALASLARLAERQHGLLTERQLKRVHVVDKALLHAVDAGLLRRECEHVFACAGAPQTRLRMIMSRVLWAMPGVWVSHATAAELYGISLPRDAVTDDIELTMRRGRIPDIGGVALHRTLHLARAELTRVNGVPVTSAARMVVDLSGRLGPTALGRVVDDVVFGHLASISEIAAVSERLPRAKGRSKKKLRVALASRADLEDFETQLEQFMFDALDTYCIERPESQVWVTACGNPYRLDGFYDRLPPIALEADGWIFRRSRSAFDRDHKKDRDLRAAGFLLLRFTSADCDWNIAAEVARALGVDIPAQPSNGGMTYHEWKRRRDHGRC